MSSNSVPQIDLNDNFKDLRIKLEIDPSEEIEAEFISIDQLRPVDIERSNIANLYHDVLQEAVILFGYAIKFSQKHEKPILGLNIILPKIGCFIAGKNAIDKVFNAFIIPTYRTDLNVVIPDIISKYKLNAQKNKVAKRLEYFESQVKRSLLISCPVELDNFSSYIVVQVHAVRGVVSTVSNLSFDCNKETTKRNVHTFIDKDDAVAKAIMEMFPHSVASFRQTGQN
ncbi:uncharacterized protein LOC116352547 [Contarinia nasturtii]|uniref:uncharacterized protein LOC116352547 n=1 Tax=Contarinia nasturtii TaxID=265458 RepID=UPI0012D4B40D|nr:uncharacterized protein LOC116352547 [Contarinia nasturtii]XP_031641094.1 uncharacterized protein LOC116352547 [Contarinia nasturtii]